MSIHSRSNFFTCRIGSFLHFMRREPICLGAMQIGLTRSKGAASKGLLAGLLFAISASVFAAITWAFISLHEQNSPGPAAAHVVMILDLTDGLSCDQQRTFLDEFKHLRDTLRVGERFSFYVIMQDGDRPGAQAVRLFSKCCLEDGSQTDFKIGNPKRPKRRFQEEFIQPLERIVNSLTYTQKAVTTPIMGTLREVARTPDFASAKTRKLVLFSNLLENSEHISHYGRYESIAGLKERSLLVLDTQGILSGVEVIAFQIPDIKEWQGLAHTKWWQDYFEYTGAASFELKRI